LFQNQNTADLDRQTTKVKYQYFTVMQEERKMPVDDPDKKLIAMRNLIYFKICRKCGARNALSAKRCRRCRSGNLRFKRREIGK